ncbi:MAG: hypothetical protein DLM58_18905, partial [Pseudonocardiales bacterium]
TTGKMDDIDVADIRRFESELLDYIAHNSPELFDTLANAKALEDSMVADLDSVVDAFTKQFQPSDPDSAGPSAKDADSKDADKSGDKSGDKSADKATEKPATDKSGDKPAKSGGSDTAGKSDSDK